MALPNNPTPAELVKAVKELEQGGSSGGGIQEISTQYVMISTLDTGIYKLTYNGTIYVQYYGSSLTRTINLPTSNGSYLLFVQKYNSTGFWNWELTTNVASTIGEMEYVRKYIGVTTASSGDYVQIRPSQLTNIAQTDNTNSWVASQIPNQSNTHDLGSSEIQWNNIYANVIYQNGKQVANVEDLPTKVSDLTNDSGFITSASLPTKVSDLTNDAGFITNTVSNLVNYYTKTETYTKTEVQQLIDSIGGLSVEVVQTLPTTDISTTTIYLVPKTGSSTGDAYDEYLYISNAWEKIGSTEIDLSNYYTKTQTDTLLGNKQDTITSTNKLDYSLLSNTPTIPTVNDATLTLQLNGSQIDTFTANASANKTINVKALPNFSLSIGSTNGGNPRQVKFLSVNYTNYDGNNACFIKLGAMCSHGNGTSYTFMDDIFIGVSSSGSVLCNVYKYFQQAVTLDSVERNYGDVFYTIDTTNKVVDFYILLGQYSTANFTPYTKIGATTTNGITQLSGTPTYYSSGTKTWATGNSTLYARLSDIPTSVNGLSGGTISSDVTVSGNVYANYLEGTWLKSTDATDTGSWTDVWVNSGGWLYKRSKENFKSDLNIPDTSNFVTTNTKQTIEARKKFYLSGSNTPLVVKTALAQAFIEFQDSNNSTMGSLGVNESKKPVFFDNYEHELAYASDIPTKLSQLSQDASYRTVTDTEKTTWNGKNGATTYNLVNDSGQAATSGYVRKRIANINGQYLTFHKQYSSTSPQTFSGGPFTNVLLAWVEQASTSDTQSQRTTLKSVDNSKWSINGNYKHWICVIGFTN